MSIHPKLLLPLTALFAIGSLSTASGANLLFDPGFENPITFNGPPFTDSWEGFRGDGASAANSGAMPRTGAQSLRLEITSTNNSFAGAFQDVDAMTAGSAVNFTGWHATTSSPFDVGVEIRIEWRNSTSNTEVSRTGNLTPVPGSSYSMFDLASVVPAGADVARVVYAIQSFGPGDTNSGITFIDDVSLTVVPEPTVALTGGLAALGLMLRRRRA